MGTALFSLSHSGLVEREHRTGRERKLSSNRRSGSLARAVVVEVERGRLLCVFCSLHAQEERKTGLASNKPVFVTSDQLLALRN